MTVPKVRPALCPEAPLLHSRVSGRGPWELAGRLLRPRSCRPCGWKLAGGTVVTSRTGGTLPPQEATARVVKAALTHPVYFS